MIVSDEGPFDTIVTSGGGPIVFDGAMNRLKVPDGWFRLSFPTADGGTSAVNCKPGKGTELLVDWDSDQEEFFVVSTASKS